MQDVAESGQPCGTPTPVQGKILSENICPAIGSNDQNVSEVVPAGAERMHRDSASETSKHESGHGQPAEEYADEPKPGETARGEGRQSAMATRS